MQKIQISIIAIVSMAMMTSLACNKDEYSNNPIVVTYDEPLIDIEGNSYKTIKIGNQIWMAENFKAIKTAVGQNIQEAYVYNDDNSNSTSYGRLYTWIAAVQATPSGWHLPTKEEWELLINASGGNSNAGGKLKEIGISHWNSPNTGATNASGFTAVAGGFRGGDGIYYDLGKHGSYWGTANSAQDPFCVYIYYNAPNVISEVSPIDKTSGIAFAVRYVRD